MILGVQQPLDLLLLLRIRPDRSIQQRFDRLVAVDQARQLPLNQAPRGLTLTVVT